MPLSIDTFRPEVARRALAAGATWLNAADGLQDDELVVVAADAGCPIVLPFLNGPSPLALAGAVLIGLAFLPILRGLMLMLAWPLMMSGAL